MSQILSKFNSHIALLLLDFDLDVKVNANVQTTHVIIDTEISIDNLYANTKLTRVLYSFYVIFWDRAGFFQTLSHT